MAWGVDLAEDREGAKLVGEQRAFAVRRRGISSHPPPPLPHTLLMQRRRAIEAADINKSADKIHR